MPETNHCTQCSWLLTQVGACRPPSGLNFFSIISFIPYFIVLLFILLTFFNRRKRQLKVTMLLLSVYIFSDRIVKRIIKIPSLEGACGEQYGFPSIHMVLFCCYLMEIWMNCKKGQKIFLTMMIMLQAFARVNLKYNNWQQVIGGVAFGVVYSLIFDMAFQKLAQGQKFKELCEIMGIKQEKGEEKQKKN